MKFFSFKYISCLLLAGFSIYGASAQLQQLEYPVKGVNRYYAASFGEIRTTHLHGGVDLKTDGVQGKEVVAGADGYVSMVDMSHSGYGLAIQIKYPGVGYSALFAHLSRIRPDIMDEVNRVRRAEGINAGQVTLQAYSIPVRRGETVAWSGNSGASKGPHVHYELRSLLDGRLLSPIAQHTIEVQDHIPPQILRLVYVPVDSVSGVAVRGRLREYAAVKSEGKYRIQGPVSVGRRGYFLVKVTDRRDSVWNRFGISRALLEREGKTVLEYNMESIPSFATFHSYSVSYFGIPGFNSCNVIRLAHPENTPKCFYPRSEERGLVRAAEGEKADYRLVVEDECRNESELLFSVVGCPEKDSFRAPEQHGEVLGLQDTVTVQKMGVRLQVCREALPEPEFESISKYTEPWKDTSTVVVSDFYHLMERTRAFVAPVKVSIKSPRRHHAVLAVKDYGGIWRPVKALYNDGWYEGTVRAAVDVVLVEDRRAPSLRAEFLSGANLRSAKFFSFLVSDNFSGIEDFECLVDGKFVEMNYPYRSSRVSHFFTGQDPKTGTRHKVEFRVWDKAGNESRWEGEFIR